MREQAYRQFVEEKTKHIISRNHVAVVDDDKQSIFVDQHFSHHERFIHFRASDGQPFALRVRSYPDQHKVVFRLGYFYLEPTKGNGYEFRVMNENHIWHGLSSRRDELISRLLVLPEFRLLHLTNLLVVDDKKIP